MTASKVSITSFVNSLHRGEVVALWTKVFGYEAAHNWPELVIDKKLAIDDDLFFVAISGNAIIGTIMAGYDGHRGWIYSLAVSQSSRRRGIGSALLSHAENALIGKGCVKINLQILEENESVMKFYARLGYAQEKRISMGKRIQKNVHV
jgi:ribosomal protein S18 acetylase RimI-like enzyme